jgi:F-type H+-transporting ATPase subunit delta
MSDKAGNESIARRYAQALVELAASQNAIDQVGADLWRFAWLVGATGVAGNLGEVLASPVFTVDERARVLDQILPKSNVHPLVANLVRLVNDKRRFPILGDIALAYRTMADERANRTRVTVQTAWPLDPETEGSVRSALEAATRKAVVLSTEVRPELIGGMVAKVGDTLYDSSIKSQLEQMRQSLLQASPTTA